MMHRDSNEKVLDVSAHKIVVRIQGDQGSEGRRNVFRLPGRVGTESGVPRAAKESVSVEKSVQVGGVGGRRSVPVGKGSGSRYQTVSVPGVRPVAFDKETGPGRRTETIDCPECGRMNVAAGGLALCPECGAWHE